MNNYNYLSKFLLIPFAFIVLIFITGCETTEPPERKPESVREYTWQIDTLNIPDASQNLMRSVWASEPNNIYICGHNSGSQIYEGNGNMWHYDGTNWEVEDVYNIAGSNGNLLSVHGSSSTNVWAVGYRGRYDQELGEDIQYPYIVHFNGSRWNRHTVDTKHAVYGVYVENESSVWACGDGGLVYQYDGLNWDVDTIKIEMEKDDIFQLSSIIIIGDKKYVRGVTIIENGETTIDYFFIKENNTWILKDSFLTDSQNQNYKFGNWLYKSKMKKLYSHGMGGIFVWENDDWKNLFPLTTSINSISIDYNDNILAVGSFSKVYHYNGTNWELFSRLEYNDAMYTGVLLYENEAFIIGNDLSQYPMKSFVLHGK